MNDFISSLQSVMFSMQQNLSFVLYFIGILWLINLVNFFLGYRLNYLGIVPRTKLGLIGIFFSPFLHGNFNHLFLNTVPLFVLSSLILLNGLVVFIVVSMIIIVLSGFAVWLFGRKALHIGSSSLIMGYFGYLLIQSYYQPSVVTIIITGVCIYYFGGMFVLALMPGKKETSWEGHFFGFVAGMCAVYLYPIINSVLISFL